MRYFYQYMLKKEEVYKGCRMGLFGIVLLVISNSMMGQTPHDSIPSKVTLQQCIAYALKHQAQVQQSMLDEDITKRDIRIALSGWYPQIEFDANLDRYLQAPNSNYPNTANPPSYTPYISLPSVSNYESIGTLYANQTIYSNALLFASRTSKQLRSQASENTENLKINTYVDVTKAFFDVLLTEQQLNVLKEDIVRLQKNYDDAYNFYKNGLTDKIDYQRTQIALSNAQAQKRSTEEAIKGKYSVLKQLAGIPPEKVLSVSYDSSRYESEILFDTSKNLDYNKRIEYQQMQTSLNLQNDEISYYRWSFIPTLSAFFDYDPAFQNNNFNELYKVNYPTTLFGLKLTIPLFQGLNRIENLSKAKLQSQRIQLGMNYLKSAISSEYTIALGSYVSNLNDLKIARNNVTVARDIFNTVKFQYDKGIKAYLEVIVSETDLRTAELNYLNILFQVLTSKMDLEKALGDIKIN
ncbi:MAG: TolC family protein [Bacteroidales bacterium]|jgi:outer membrane protein TolC